MERLINRFSIWDRYVLKNIIKRLKLSQSNQQKLLTYCYEIKRLNHWSLYKILIKSNYRKILKNPNIQGKKIGEKVIKNIFNLRYPETTKLINKGLFKL